MIPIAVVIVVLSSLAAPSVQAEPSSHIELSSLYQAVLAHNPEWAAAQSANQAKQEQLPQARAMLLPAITSTLSSQSAYVRADTEPHGRRDSRRQVTAHLRQPLVNAALWYQLDSAQAGADQAALELTSKRQQILLVTAQAYFETLRAVDEEATSTAETRAFEQQLKQAQGRLTGGLSTMTDVLEAQAALDNAQANRLLARRKVDDAYEQLFKMTRQRYTSIERLVDDLPADVPMPADAERWVAAALRQSPALAARQAALAAATHRFSQQRSGHAPTVDAVASYSAGGEAGYGAAAERTRASVGLELKIPLYSGGLVSSQSREARHRMAESQEQWEHEHREVVTGTRTLYRAVYSDVEQIRARLQTLRSSEASLEATQMGAEVGTRNVLDVLSAQRRRFMALREYQNARYDYLINTLRLKQVSGTLVESELDQLSMYMRGQSRSPLLVLSG